MIQRLFILLPEEAYLVALTGAGLLMIVGMRRAAIGIVTGVVFLALFGPFIDALIENLPDWLLVPVMLGGFLCLVSLLFSRRVTDNLIARLLYDLILLPFRLSRGILRRVFRNGQP